MAKKKNKKHQQKRQAKALKQRTRRQQSKKERPKRKQMLPGNLPPGAMSGTARKMMEFAAPLAGMIDPSDMAQMQEVGKVIQVLWQAFSEPDMEERQIQLESLREIYESFGWAAEPYEHLLKNLLMRHIYLMPQLHSEEERAQFTPEELEAAMEVGAPEETAAEFDQAGPEESPEPAVELVEASPLEFSPALAPELIGEGPWNRIQELQRLVSAGIEGQAMRDRESEGYQTVLSLHRMVVELFLAYLHHADTEVETLQNHRSNLLPFLVEFLPDRRNTTLHSSDEDQLEEYLLDYYLRKVERPSAAEDLLFASFSSFCDFAAALGFLDDPGPYQERLAEIRNEYTDLLASERAARSDSARADR